MSVPVSVIYLKPYQILYTILENTLAS